MDLQLDFVIDLVRLHFILHIFIRVNRLVIDGRNDVARLQSGFLGSGLFNHPENNSAGIADGIFAGQTHVHFLDLGTRRPHADLFRLDYSENDTWILAIIVDANPAQIAGRQAFGQFLEALAAIRSFVKTAARPPLLRWIVGVVQIALAFVGGD